MTEHSLFHTDGAKGRPYPYLSRHPRPGPRIEVVRTMLAKSRPVRASRRKRRENLTQA